MKCKKTVANMIEHTEYELFIITELLKYFELFEFNSK